MTHLQEKLPLSQHIHKLTHTFFYSKKLYKNKFKSHVTSEKKTKFSIIPTELDVHIEENNNTEDVIIWDDNNQQINPAPIPASDPPLIDLERLPTPEPSEATKVTQPEAKRPRLQSPQNKSKEDTDEDEENAKLCPICLELWTNAGPHRLCCLACGHLFGHSCIVRWLTETCTVSTRRCPQCNEKASPRDIRVLYTRNLIAYDTSCIAALQQERDEAVKAQARMAMELSKAHWHQKIYEQQFVIMANRMAELQRQYAENLKSRSVLTVTRFYLNKTAEVGKDANCRVLDYNSHHRCIAVSQKSSNPLFAGFGVRKFDPETLEPKQFVMLHTKLIRDIAFHESQPNLLVTASIDKTVKILDVHNNVPVHGYPTDSCLWSCCWSSVDCNTIFAGSQNGTITEFDIRQTSGAVCVHASPGDPSPVVSLASIPAHSSTGMMRGGFIAAHLNSCYGYEYNDRGTWSIKNMSLQGPFMAVRYDEKNRHGLVSCRPNAIQPNATQTVFTIDTSNETSILCNNVHVFVGSKSQQLLSRPCHIDMGDDTLVAAYNETGKCVTLNSVAFGESKFSIPVSDPVLDMCSFNSANDKPQIVTLGSNKLRLYSLAGKGTN